MVELIRGIKAGVVAGLIYGAFYAFVFLVFFVLLASLLDIPITPLPFSGEYVTWRVNPLMALIVGPIYGAILGIIYALTYNRLPGKQLGKWTVSMTKGMVLALIVWVILFLLALLTWFPPGLLFHELEKYRTFQILLTVFASWIFVGILGQQLGRFWDRFKPK